MIQQDRIKLHEFTTTTNYSNVVNILTNANSLIIRNEGDEACYVSIDGVNDHIYVASLDTLVIPKFMEHNKLAVKSTNGGKKVYITSWYSK